MSDDEPFPVLRPGIVPWLVGLFALWQFAFLPLANVLDFVPRRPTAADTKPLMNGNQEWGRFTSIEPIQRGIEFTGDAFAFWGEASGQRQGWTMFTPGFPPHTLVPLVELHFPDGTVERVPSRFEPRDLANPQVRPPIVDDRMFNYEIQVVIAGWFCDENSLRARPEYWSQLPERVREQERRITQWLRWQVQQYRDSHPDRPEPVEVVLSFRYIPTPLPREPRGWTNRPAIERPFARWRPGANEPGYLAIEGYDPIAGRWVKLKSENAP